MNSKFLGQVCFETFLLSKRAVTASFSSIIRTYVRESAANPGNRVNRGGPGSYPARTRGDELGDI